MEDMPSLPSLWVRSPLSVSILYTICFLFSSLRETKFKKPSSRKTQIQETLSSRETQIQETLIKRNPNLVMDHPYLVMAIPIPWWRQSFTTSWQNGRTFHLPPVRDQSDYSTVCSIIATTQCISACYSIAHNRRPGLIAIQEPLNEVPKLPEFVQNRDYRYCLGVPSFEAWPDVTFRYIQRYNIGMEMDMPFVLWPHERSILPGLRMGISSYVVRDASFRREIDYIVREQHPVVGVFSGYGKDFRDYSGGLYRGLPNGRDDCQILHSVLITDAGEHYYEIMNSAGPSWGIRGFGYVRKSLFVEFSYPLEAPFLVGDDDV